MGLYFGRNPRATIPDFNDDVMIFAEGAKPKFPMTEHGFDGILDDVCPYLVQL